MLSTFGLVVVVALTWTAISSGWQNEVWGAVAFSALVSGLGAFVLRSEECTLTPEGIRHTIKGASSGVDSKSRHSNGCETGFRAGFPELPLDDETFRIRLDVKIFRVEFRG